MATVKTKVDQSGALRIITKVVNGQRRVSCSCCPGDVGCCMYPAEELGNLYGAEDLPDAVTVNWAGRFTGSMSKSGGGYAGGDATLQIVNGIWQLSDSDGTRNVGRCLIRGDGNLTQGDDLVEDQFADTYTVSNEFASVVVNRVSLCIWEGTNENNENAGLYYAGGGFEAIGQGSFKWYSFLSTEFGEGLGPKQSGNQNTPTGTYQDPIALNTWTVSE